MMMLFSKNILSNEVGKTIVFDVKCSDFLPQIIKENDGIPFMSPTGHFHIKNNIKKYNALLGGEMSGHIFFNDVWHGFDDGHYSAVRLLDIMNETGLSLDDLLDSLPVSYSTPELNIDVPEESKFKIIEDFIENASIDGEKDFTDGLRASFENGWALLRASNTTPKLVLRFEANSQESLVMIQKNFLEELKKFLPSEDINLE
jgi:phosphomannomutase/phosphoglucomutase